jgi:general stress protein 26
MTFEELKQFIKQVGWGMLATTDGRIVGIRPMGAVAWKGSCFLCATHAASDKIAQLRKVPYAEYCFCDSTGKHVRIAGSCMVSTDNAEKLWLYKELPGLKEHVSDPASPDYVIIKMTPENIRVMNLDFTYTQVKLK